MSICIRTGSWFHERPFGEGEKRRRKFQDRVLDEGKGTSPFLNLVLGYIVDAPRAAV
jgi:hypothetical protein